MSLLVLPMLLLACGNGPSDETLVDELRVLATLTDPPEALAGETVSVDTLVVDPLDAGFEVLTWACTFTGEGCLEEEELTGFAWEGLSYTPDQAGSTRFSSSTTVSPFVGDFLSEEPIPLVQLWTLACEPGLCPAMDLAAADPEAGSEEAAALQAVLADPSEQMKDLPFQGASLGVRWLYASTRAEGERLENPEISCEVVSQEGEAVPTVVAGESLGFTCFVSGEFDGYAGAWGYATNGGWEGPTYLLDPGVTLLDYTWFAPEEVPEDSTVDLWVVLVDGQGGVGLWEGSAEVTGG